MTADTWPKDWHRKSLLSPEEGEEKIYLIQNYYQKPINDISNQEIDKFDEWLSGEQAFNEALANVIDESPFKPQSCEQFATLQTNGWLIKNILPKAQLAVIYGAPGCGKSFVALDMAMTIARNLPLWCDYKVKPGKVVYVCAEAPHGFKNRILAYSERHKIPLSDLNNFTIIPDAPNLLKHEHVAQISHQLGKCDLIVIDTLARVMTGGDENSGKDVGLLIEHCQQIHKITGATVVLIHHTGKDVDKGSRGWSGLLGAVDTELKVEAIGNDHSITVTKQKEGESGQKIGFNLDRRVLGIDEEDDEITSCTFEHSQVIAQKHIKEEKLGGVQKIIMDSIYKIPERPVMIDDLIALVIANMPFDKEKKDERRKRFFHSLETLQDKGILSVSNNFVYVENGRG